MEIRVEEEYEVVGATGCLSASANNMQVRSHKTHQKFFKQKGTTALPFCPFTYLYFEWG